MSFLGTLGAGNLGNARGSISIDTSSAQQAAAQMRSIAEQIQQVMQNSSGVIASAWQQVQQAMQNAGNIMQAVWQQLNNTLQASGNVVQRVKQQLQGLVGRGLEQAGQGIQSFGQKIEQAGVAMQQSLQPVGPTAQQVGQQIQQAANRPRSALRSLIGLINELRFEIAALGLAAGVLTRQGLLDADTIRSYRIQFTALLGDQRQAVSIMEGLAETANEFGGNLESFFALGRTMLPVLKAVGGELDDWVERAARLASTDPTQGIQGAIIAMREFTAGQARSLRERFEIPITLVQQAREQFSDVGEQMDFILERMGATRQAAIEMAQGFRGSMAEVRNELQQTLAVGFTPLMEQAIVPLLNGMADFLRVLRETNPELLHTAANVTAIVAAVAPLLLLVSQLARMMAVFKDPRIAGALASLGRVGMAGAGIGLIGAGVTGLNRQVEKDTGINVLQGAWQWFVTGMQRAFLLLDNAIREVVRSLYDIPAAWELAIGLTLVEIGNLLPGGDALVRAGEGLLQAAAALRQSAVLQTMRTSATEGERRGMRRPFAVATTAPEFTEGQLEAIVDWRERVQEIERNANQERLSATQDYESQRSSVIRDYELQLVREAQDFALQRLRAVQQLARNIARIQEDAARREAEWREDLEERIADIREDSQERIEDMERDHRDRVEQLTRDHRVRLLELAARLDARGVVEENRRFNNQLRDMQQDLDKRTEQERENLEERIQQEREAAEERILEAREADQRRIEDMQEAFDEEQRIADEDRAIRLRRMAEDHRNQLDEMAQVHRERLIQITQQARDERNELDREFVKRLVKLGLHNQALLELQERWQNAALKLFREFWKKVVEDAEQALRPRGRRPREGDPVPYQHGGPVMRTGLGLLHRGEQVLNAGTSEMLRRLMGGSFNQQQLVGAVAGGSSVSLMLGPGSIVVNESQRPGMTGAEIEGALLRIVQGLA